MPNLLRKRCPECNGKLKIECLEFGQLCYECLKCGYFFEADDQLPSEKEIDEFDRYEETLRYDNLVDINDYDEIDSDFEYDVNELFIQWLCEIENKTPITAKQNACYLRQIRNHYIRNEEPYFPCSIEDIDKLKEIIKLYDKGGKYQNFGKYGRRRISIKTYQSFFEYKIKTQIVLEFFPKEEELFSLLLSMVQKVKVIIFYKNTTSSERIWTNCYYKTTYSLRTFIYNAFFLSNIWYDINIIKIRFELDMNNQYIAEHMNFIKLEKNAEQGNDNSQYELGNKYYVSDDYRKAKFWFEKSAAQGNSKAQYKIGEMYLRERKFENAIEWFRKAASRENHYAQYCLSCMYRDGIGIQQDLTKARELFDKSKILDLSTIAELQKMFTEL